MTQAQRQPRPQTWQWSGKPGMDLHEALRAATKLVGRVESYLEIGVDGGGSLNTLLCEVIPQRIVLCDLWDPQYCGHGDTKLRVLEILGFFGAHAEFFDGDSKETVPLLKETFDLVTVDGDHSEQGALTDLQNAWPLVRRGGILVMDDINHRDYPWLRGVWKSMLQRWRDEQWSFDLPIELHGGCNAAMIRKR